MAGHDRGDRRPGAVVRHVNEVEAERQFQLLAHEVRDRTGASRAEGEFGGTGLDQREQLGNGFCRHRWVDHDDHVVGGRKRDRLEVAERIVGHLAEEHRIDGETADIEQDGVAVGRRLGHLRGADAAARTADVLDIELLAELLAQFLHHQPGEDIRRAAGRERHDHAHRPCRIRLRPGDAWPGRRSRSADGEQQKSATVHGLPSQEAWRDGMHQGYRRSRRRNSAVPARPGRAEDRGAIAAMQAARLAVTTSETALSRRAEDLGETVPASQTRQHVVVPDDIGGSFQSSPNIERLRTDRDRRDSRQRGRPTRPS